MNSEKKFNYNLVAEFDKYTIAICGALLAFIFSDLFKKKLSLMESADIYIATLLGISAVSGFINLSTCINALNKIHYYEALKQTEKLKLGKQNKIIRLSGKVHTWSLNLSFCMIAIVLIIHIF